MLSNCSISEHNTINGTKGDQTGSEYKITNWYNGNWMCILRYPDTRVLECIAQNATYAANNNNIGYGQSDRGTFWSQLQSVNYDASKITTPCNADCSSSTCAIVKAAGYILGISALQSIGLLTTSTMRSAFRSAGFQVLTDSKYLTSENYLVAGDILLRDTGHTCISVGTGEYASTDGLSTVSSYEDFSRSDSLVREFAYLNDSYDRSTNSNKLKLSIINCSAILHILSEVFGISSSDSYSSGSVDTTGLTGNVRTTVDFLIGKGLNGAAACGVAGNIKHESNFNTAAIGDNGTSFGICQWHNSRGTAMKSYVGSNWASNLTGQLNFLWKELTESYTSVLSHLKSVSESESGCKSAADYFVRKFEVPANVNSASITRQASAVEYYKQLKFSTASSDTGSMQGRSGKSLTLQKTVSVPSSVNQTGIIPNYTNYTYWYSRWSKGTYQRTIADVWNSKGRTNNRGIATLCGHYLVAMSSIFATTGDLVVVHLANGSSFSAILGDSKGSDAGSPYGHILSGGVDIIEWEAYGTSSSSTSGVNIDLTGWKGIKVTKVDNYGSWVNN